MRLPLNQREIEMSVLFTDRKSHTGFRLGMEWWSWRREWPWTA